MEFVKWIVGFQIVAGVISLLLIVYLIIRRKKVKKKETFEQRDN
jgi:hypothetical protein